MHMRRTVAALLVPVLIPASLSLPLRSIEAEAIASPAPDRRSSQQSAASRSAHRNLFPSAFETAQSFQTPAEPPSTTTTETPTTTAPPPTTAAPTTTTTTTPQTTTTGPPPTSPSVENPAPSEISGSVVDVALAQVGKAYRSGATGPNAFDCSGLVFYVFNQAGIAVPRLTSDGYYARYTKVTRDELVAGDLVVYPGHIAIYVGDGLIVSASTPRGGVKHYEMNNPGRIIGFARITS